ncbi:MAG: RpiB/LacA/LacB family sugar-phosphate isomerase [Bacteroidetes bacterium]|nr:MAG: RpiB/LacA/LacB family sugar-phosphate isomerase [Bacteroidota bacterium]
MEIGIAADHGGFELKNIVVAFLKGNGYELEDYGAFQLDKADDYPDFVIPLAKAVAAPTVHSGNMNINSPPAPKGVIPPYWRRVANG